MGRNRQVIRIIYFENNIFVQTGQNRGQNQNYIHQLFRDLRQTLESIGMEEIFERNNYLYSVKSKKIDCDYYSCLKNGKPEFIGEYMSRCGCAEETCELLWKKS
jgi:two-component SAPR family response regulator